MISWARNLGVKRNSCVLHSPSHSSPSPDPASSDPNRPCWRSTIHNQKRSVHLFFFKLKPFGGFTFFTGKTASRICPPVSSSSPYTPGAAPLFSLFLPQVVPHMPFALLQTLLPPLYLVSNTDSLWPHGLYSPWDSPGQNTGVGSRSLLQGIFPTQGSNPGLPHGRQILYHLSHQGSPLNT